MKNLVKSSLLTTGNIFLVLQNGNARFPFFEIDPGSLSGFSETFYSYGGGEMVETTGSPARSGARARPQAQIEHQVLPELNVILQIGRKQPLPPPTNMIAPGGFDPKGKGLAIGQKGLQIVKGITPPP